MFDAYIDAICLGPIDYSLRSCHFVIIIPWLFKKELCVVFAYFSILSVVFLFLMGLYRYLLEG